MKTRVRSAIARQALGCYRRVIAWAAIGILFSGFPASRVRADTPSLALWSAEGQEVYTCFDTLETNQWYAAVRSLWFNAFIQNADSDPCVQVDGLAVTCTLPSGLSPAFIDFDNDMPFYAQWNATYTSLLVQAAAPLTNQQGWSASLELAASNVWLRPKVQVKRMAFPTRLIPGHPVKQTVVCDVFVPPGALNGMGLFSIQLDLWDDASETLGITVLSNTCSSLSFTHDPWNYPPTFFCVSPGTLAGAYSFTYYLEITSGAAVDMNFTPGIRITYSESQSGWARVPEIPSHGLLHTYNNGIVIRTSSPTPILWDHQQEQGRTVWDMSVKWAPAENAMPSLSECELFRSVSVGYDGRPWSGFILGGSGNNIVSASLTTPDNTTYATETEPDEVDFEFISLSPAELARFTNGTYTVKLYDFTNALCQTYSLQLTGSPVAGTPNLLAPNTLCDTNARPGLSWEAAPDPDVNATVLIIENNRSDDEILEMWTEPPLPTTYQVEQDLFACWEYELLSAKAVRSMNNGAEVMTGYLSTRLGIFNVQTQNLAFAHSFTTAPRVFAGDDLGLSLFTFGFLPGSNYACRVDFGDGFATNDLWAVHHYDESGTYTTRVIVTDETGMAATGTVSMTAYERPVLDSVTRINSNMVDIGFPTIDGASYNLRYTDGLSNPDWSGWVDSILGDGSSKTVHDFQNAPAPKRFYRLECDLNPSSLGPP